MADRDKAIAAAAVQLRGTLTQTVVADEMRKRGWKWSQATVWSVESAERPLRLAEAADLAEILGARIEDLLTEPGLLTAARMARVLIGEIQAAYVESSRSMAFIVGYQMQLEKWCAMLGDGEGNKELQDLLKDADHVLDLGPSDVAARAQRLHEESDIGKLTLKVPSDG